MIHIRPGVRYTVLVGDVEVKKQRLEAECIKTVSHTPSRGLSIPPIPRSRDGTDELKLSCVSAARNPTDRMRTRDNFGFVILSTGR